MCPNTEEVKSYITQNLHSLIEHSLTVSIRKCGSAADRDLITPGDVLAIEITV